VEPAPEILTVGHSTHQADRFMKLLRAHRIALCGDVRRFPASRRHPQFNAGTLETTLADAGIGYEQLGDQLGGRRGAASNSPSAGARAQFRAYADYMASEDFVAGLRRLEGLARERRTTIMCAEGDWRRCHRGLISDALDANGWRVLHILPDGRLEDHQPTDHAASGQQLRL
jgi:uncharacterized protein (DUF488 family)